MLVSEGLSTFPGFVRLQKAPKTTDLENTGKYNLKKCK